jgi:hypothetical protein
MIADLQMKYETMTMPLPAKKCLAHGAVVISNHSPESPQGRKEHTYVCKEGIGRVGALSRERM